MGWNFPGGYLPYTLPVKFVFSNEGPSPAGLLSFNLDNPFVKFCVLLLFKWLVAWLILKLFISTFFFKLLKLLSIPATFELKPWLLLFGSGAIPFAPLLILLLFKLARLIWFTGPVTFSFLALNEPFWLRSPSAKLLLLLEVLSK